VQPTPKHARVLGAERGVWPIRCGPSNGLGGSPGGLPGGPESGPCEHATDPPAGLRRCPTPGAA
jgi:hypothetical protein